MRAGRTALLGLLLLVCGCSGGAVAVRSQVPPPAPPSSGAPAGLHASGHWTLAAAVALGAVLIDAFQSLFGVEAQQPLRGWVESAPERPGWQPIDRGWVDRGP